MVAALVTPCLQILKGKSKLSVAQECFASTLVSDPPPSDFSPLLLQPSQHHHLNPVRLSSAVQFNSLLSEQCCVLKKKKNGGRPQGRSTEAPNAGSLHLVFFFLFVRSRPCRHKTLHVCVFETFTSRVLFLVRSLLLLEISPWALNRRG